MADDTTATPTQTAPPAQADEPPAKGAPVDPPPVPSATPDVPPEMKAALHKANKEAETLRLRLKEIEDRDLSELQKAQRDAEEARREADEAKSQRAAYETTTLRQRIALEKRLPAPLVARLQGTTEEEVAADADALLALINTPGTPRPDPSQGSHTTSEKAKADAEYEQFYPSPTPR